ncbi:mandelate racemase/muconate lactonizing enzyme family protein [Aneurinibacillus sp. BA2021]|nr:mandelate racemase/muconate lactonizing enzyme family protein [Aneurinibacillus sp. BA2021]
MLIEKVETFPLLHKLARPYGDANGYKRYRTCFLIRITTQSGIEGWGECIDWLPMLEKGFQERMIPYLIGKNATNRTYIVNHIKKWNRRAAACVSMALTEIIAKHANLSICDLWGGKWHEIIPVYASFQSYTEDDNWIQNSLQLIEKTVLNGYSTIKVKVGGKTLQEDQAHLAAIQQTLNENIKIALDANQSYDASTAYRLEKLFANWTNILWFEEPIPLKHAAEYKLLRSKLSVPVAGGENLQGADQFLPFLQAGAMDIIQPDIMHEGGIDEYRNTLQLARLYGIRVSPHTYDGALARLYTLFSQACLPPWSKMKGDDIEPVEWDVMENPFISLLHLSLQKGKVAVPDEIGIGVELDEEIIKKYRWDGFGYT